MMNNPINCQGQAAEGLHTSSHVLTDQVQNKKPAAAGTTAGSEFCEVNRGHSMLNDSTRALIRKSDNSDTDTKSLNRLVQSLQRKLAGEPVKIMPPKGKAFSSGGGLQVWGFIANQTVQATNADETRAVIDGILNDFPDAAAEVWGRLEPEPDVIPFDQSIDIDKISNSDIARGHVLLPHMIGRVRWVQDWKDRGWLIWDGKRWTRDAAAVERLAKHYLPDAVAKRWGYEEAVEAAKRQNIANALWVIRSEPGIITKIEELDSNPWLLNLENGTLDLRTRELHPHKPENLITKLCLTPFDLRATCPNFINTLEKFIPDSDIRTFLKRHLGCSLTGIITHLKLPILYGLGNNGKSTITNAVVHVFGPDYATVLDADVLTDDGSKGGNSDKLYHMAKLHGMRFVVVNELEENCILRGPMLKSLVSTDKVPARRPYEMPFDYIPSHKIVMLTNHKPRLRSTDNGTMRRLALVPFEVQISPQEDVKDFGEILKAEASGILNWLIEGCQDWIEQGKDAPVPDAVKAATEEYRNDEDVIGRFIETCIKEISGGFVTGKDVYNTFKLWCEEAGIEPISGSAFGRKFGTKFDKTRSRSSQRYLGIIIKSDWNSTD